MQAIETTLFGGSIPEGYTSGVRTVGENVALIRGKKKWSQSHLADELGIKQPSMWKIENSKTLPETATLLKLAKVLGCSLDELLQDVDPAYDVARAESAHEKKTDQSYNVTSSDPATGVSSDFRVSNLHAERGSTDAEAAHVRSPLTIAVLLEKQAAYLRAGIDALDQFADELRRGAIEPTESAADTGTALKARPPEARGRPPRRRRGGER